MVAITDWIHAARPKTLAAAVAPVVTGTVLGSKVGGVFRPDLALATLGSCIALQIATNWFNDALDFLQGGDTAARLGPHRITASALVSPRTVIQAALAMLGIAMVLAIPLIATRGWPIVAIGIPSLYFCFGYTGGPLPLAYRGLGELFVILFFGLIAVAGSAFVQCGQWLPEALASGFQIGCLSTVLIALNNLRDMGEDRATGKRTLAVRFGARFARMEITGLILLTHVAGAYWLLRGKPSAFTLPLLTLGIGLPLIQWMWKSPPGPIYNRLLALGGVQVMAFAVLFCIGLLRQPV